MKFAFIIMGDFDVKRDRADIHNGSAQIIGVSSTEEAGEIARQLYDSGVDCIELCGAFGEAGAKKVIAATQNKIPVGYITHLPEQDDIYEKTFSELS